MGRAIVGRDQVVIPPKKSKTNLAQEAKEASGSKAGKSSEASEIGERGKCHCISRLTETDNLKSNM